MLDGNKIPLLGKFLHYGKINQFHIFFFECHQSCLKMIVPTPFVFWRYIQANSIANGFKCFQGRCRHNGIRCFCYWLCHTVNRPQAEKTLDELLIIPLQNFDMPTSINKTDAFPFSAFVQTGRYRCADGVYDIAGYVFGGRKPPQIHTMAQIKATGAMPTKR